MAEPEGKGFGGERVSRFVVLFGVLLFLMVVWGGLAWAVFQLFGL